MKNIYYRILLAFLFSIAGLTPVMGTHFMGVDISYECLDPCTYRVFHKTYYDCTGAATTPLPGPPPAPFINWQGQPFGCNTVPQPIQPNWVFVSYVEVTPICPSQINLTGCNGGGFINGSVEAIFYQDYNLCTGGFPPCNTFNITWSSCCRNGAITSGADNQGIYSGSTIIDPNLVPCNSSPTFVNPPVPYICPGQPFTFNQGAFDPDGDSLAYKLVPCLQGAGNQVTYFFGYSSTQPLGSTWNVTVNPVTGDVSMIPTPLGPGGGQPVVGVVCIEVEEWRGGVLIGTVVRDMQITVLPTNCPGSNPTVSGIQNPTLNNQPITPTSAFEVEGCSGLELCFDIPTINFDPTITYTVTWDENIPGASFTNLNNPWQIDTLVGNAPIIRFCWTPQQNGVYSFLITIKDDNCPLPGFFQSTVVIRVENNLLNTNAVVDTLGCNLVNFTAIADPNAKPGLSYTWLGSGGLTSNPNAQDSTFQHFYPAPGSYPWTLLVRDSIGCEASVSGVVTIVNGATANAGPDIALCSGYSISLGDQGLPGQTYQWQPATGLSNPNAPNPTITLTNNSTQPDTLTYLQIADNGFCQTQDPINIVVFPTPSVTISPASPIVCRGDSITLTAGGGTGYLWSTGDTTATLTVAPNVNTTYSVVSFANGCAAVPVFETVQVTDPPVAQLSGVTEVCPGASTVLLASGAPNYIWSVPNTGNTLNANNITSDTTFYVVPQEGQCLGDTVFASVTTFEEPQADFSSDVVCQGLATSFSDLSTIPSGQIILWRWDFGDPASGVGNTSTLRNPTHVFTSSGTYNVSLTVTSENGCTNVIQQLVEVRPIPQVDFNFTNVCLGQDNVFTDNSTIASGTITNYVWDYGDGSPVGTGPTTNHTYAASGFYNVSLTLTSDNGCQSSYTQTVFVHPNPVADFEILSACEDSTVFTANLSTVEGNLDYISGVNWNFGDPSSPNNTSTAISPVHSYPGPGVYTVTLEVTTQNGCTDQVVRDVEIYDRPTVDFIAENLCENELTNFTPSIQIGGPGNPQVSSYIWDFGDGNNSQQSNPRHTFNAAGPGVYNVSLTVESGKGCVETITKPVTIDPAPEPRFFAQNVCDGSDVQFNDTSQIASGGIIAWQWDFGDGVGTSVLQDPTYQYQAPGEYWVSLQASSDKGCVETRRSRVTIHPNPPEPTIVNDTVCFGDQAFLQANSSPDLKVNWYSNASIDQPFHTGYTYVTGPLPFDANFFVEAESKVGCTSTRIPVYGYVFSDETAQMLIDPEEVRLPLGIVNFEVSSTADIVDYNWNFGNGSTSTQPSPAYEYTAPGIYTVKVNLIDVNGCEITLERTVEVVKVVTLFVPTAFTPNNDGSNDFFFIGHENLVEMELRIFNRWGQMIYQTQDLDFQWDGRDQNGKIVPEGVYTVNIRALDTDGEDVEENRSLTVLR